MVKWSETESLSGYATRSYQRNYSWTKNWRWRKLSHKFSNPKRSKSNNLYFEVEARSKTLLWIHFKRKEKVNGCTRVRTDRTVVPLKNSLAANMVAPRVAKSLPMIALLRRQYAESATTRDTFRQYAGPQWSLAKCRARMNRIWMTFSWEQCNFHSQKSCHSTTETSKYYMVFQRFS